MKFYIKISLFLLAFIGNFSVQADEQPPVSSKKETILIPGNKRTTRPEAPSRVFIMCAYDSEHIYFQLPAGINFITVDLTGETDQWSGVATSENPCVEIPDLIGEYEIVCTTDDGRVFSGLLTF